MILACLALGALLLALRAAGNEVGWAFQLQDPKVRLLLDFMAERCQRLIRETLAVR